MVKVLVPTTNLSHRVLMDPSATALVEERAASSITRSVTMDRDAASSAGWVSPTAHGTPRTGTLMMASELITQEKIDQETRGTTGDQSFLAISKEHWILLTYVNTIEDNVKLKWNTIIKIFFFRLKIPN